MRFYTIHTPTGVSADVIVRAQAVKEGFCWPAFIFNFLWALWHRLWLAAAGLLVATGLAAGILTLLGAGDSFHSLATLAIALIFGFVANDLRRWTLKRGKFQERDVVSARTAEQAVQSFILSRQPRAAR